MLRTKKSLMLVVAVGLAIAGAAGGTFASFNAETTNAGNTINTGTLTLSDKVNTGTACWSYQGTGAATTPNKNTSTCDALFSASPFGPGDNIQVANVILHNGGSIDPASFKLYAPSACQVDTSSALTFSANVDLCAGTFAYVQEWKADPNTGTPAPAQCWFGVQSSATTCVGAVAAQAGSPETTDKTTLNAATLSGNSLADLTANTSGVSLTYPTASSLTDFASGNGVLPHGQSRYFTIGLYIPTNGSTDNTYQGLGAAFDLSWQLNQ